MTTLYVTPEIRALLEARRTTPKAELYASSPEARFIRGTDETAYGINALHCANVNDPPKVGTKSGSCS